MARANNRIHSDKIKLRSFALQLYYKDKGRCSKKAVDICTHFDKKLVLCLMNNVPFIGPTSWHQARPLNPCER